MGFCAVEFSFERTSKYPIWAWNKGTNDPLTLRSRIVWLGPRKLAVWGGVKVKGKAQLRAEACKSVDQR